VKLFYTRHVSDSEAEKAEAVAKARGRAGGVRHATSTSGGLMVVVAAGEGVEVRIGYRRLLRGLMMKAQETAGHHLNRGRWWSWGWRTERGAGTTEDPHSGDR
jgi:hypothetical protein